MTISRKTWQAHGLQLRFPDFCFSGAASARLRRRQTALARQARCATADEVQQNAHSLPPLRLARDARRGRP